MSPRIVNQQTQESPPQPHHNLTINMVSSIAAGTFNAAWLHPIDRGIFLSTLHKRKFFIKANFTNAFHGIGQTMCYKPIIGSIYYFTQSELQTSLKPLLKNDLKLSEPGAQFCIGLVAATIDSVFKNPVSAIKAHTWQNVKSGAFFSSVTTMWNMGGIAAFTKGTRAGLYRDVPFGGIYEVARSKMRITIEPLLPQDAQTQTKVKPATNFICDTVAAGTATVAVSFFNYARIMQHGTHPEKKPPTTLESITSLVKESKQVPGFARKISFFRQSLCIGPGAARVALGMSVGQAITDNMKTLLNR